MSEQPFTAPLACPFCGKEDGVYPSYSWPGGGKPNAIDCVCCGFDFVPRKDLDVIALWNKRPALHDAAPAMYEALKAILPAVDAYLISGDAGSRALKARTWNRDVHRARAALSQAEASKKEEGR